MNFQCESWEVWHPKDAKDKPNVSFIPPLERRRLTGVERIALSVAWKVLPQYEVPVVFASRWGEIGVTLKLMRQFWEEHEMSPAGFSASVHNATPGVLSVLTHNHAPYTAIAAQEETLSCALVEAFSMQQEVLLIYAEEATPVMYQPYFPDVQEGVGLALRLKPVTNLDYSETTKFSMQVSWECSEEAKPLTVTMLEAFLRGETEVLSTRYMRLGWSNRADLA